MNTNFLTVIRRLAKLYDKVMRPIREKYNMSQFEIDVLAFLHNNKDKDTASQIVRYRMIPKANVSQAVDSLTKKQMLNSIRDEKDRRRVHLKINEKAKDAIDDILKGQEQFVEFIFSEFSKDEKEQFYEFSNRISENIVNYIQKEDGNGKE